MDIWIWMGYGLIGGLALSAVIIVLGFIFGWWKDDEE